MFKQNLLKMKLFDFSRPPYLLVVGSPEVVNPSVDSFFFFFNLLRSPLGTVT